MALPVAKIEVIGMHCNQQKLLSFHLLNKKTECTGPMDFTVVLSFDSAIINEGCSADESRLSEFVRF